jgi:hypothetical protein
MRDEVITALDRQIQEALAVDPSPEFQARVRIRLADEAPGYGAGTGWLLSAVTGVAVAVVLAVFISSPDEVSPRPDSVVAPGAAGSVTSVEPASPPAIQQPTAERARVRRVTRRTATETTQRVLVPPAEREAFRRFLQAVTEHPLIYAVVPDAREDAPLSVPEITIEPILIEPIDAAGE